VACYHADMSETRAPAMTAEQILEKLPHRFPFLLIDRVLELTEDKVVALKNVSFGEPYFQGHFPGMPVMPGVLQVEAMAQAGAILASKVIEYDATTHVVYFMTIDGVKFRRPVVPGDQLIIEVVPLRKGKIFKARGECKVDGVVVSQAEFMATVAPRPKAT
jgi:beta-hydroxyacyl-ACP dehydratase FabZ